MRGAGCARSRRCRLVLGPDNGPLPVARRRSTQGAERHARCKEPPLGFYEGIADHANLLSTLRTPCYHAARKTRYWLACSALARLVSPASWYELCQRNPFLARATSSAEFGDMGSSASGAAVVPSSSNLPCAGRSRNAPPPQIPGVRNYRNRAPASSDDVKRRCPIGRAGW